MNTKTIILLDSNVAVLSQLRGAFSESKEYSVVYSSDDGDEGIKTRAGFETRSRHRRYVFEGNGRLRRHSRSQKELERGENHCDGNSQRLPDRAGDDGGRGVLSCQTFLRAQRDGADPGIVDGKARGRETRRDGQAKTV